MSTDSDPPTDDEQVRELVRDELANALSEADIDLDDLPQKSGTTRREVLKAAGLAGAAGLTGAAGMNSATEPVSAGTKSSGNVGAAGDPVDVVAEDIYGPGGQGSGDAVAFEAIEADTSTVNEQIEHGGEPDSTLYVRATGSDSNAGFSSSNAKATIAGALDAVPKLRLGAKTNGIERVRIDLEAGGTYTISSVHKYAFPEQVLVQLYGDATTPPTIEMDASNVFRFTRSKLDVRDLNFNVLNSGTGNTMFYQAQSYTVFDNVNFNGQPARHIGAFYNGYVQINGNCTIDGGGSAGATDGVAVHSSTHLRMDGTVQNCNKGILGDRGGTGDIIGAVIDNNSVGIEAQDGAKLKFDSGDLTNNGTGIRAKSGHTDVRATTITTLSGNTTVYDVKDLALVEKPDGTFIRGDNLQSGSKAFSPGAATGTGTDTQSNQAKTVTFNRAFSSTPNVQATVQSTQSELVQIEVYNVSTTGFSIIARNYTNTDPVTVNAVWEAREP